MFSGVISDEFTALFLGACAEDGAIRKPAELVAEAPHFFAGGAKVGNGEAVFKAEGLEVSHVSVVADFINIPALATKGKGLREPR